MQHTRERIALWLDDGRPVRLVWEGRRYTVNDTPTRLGDPAETWWPAEIMHAPPGFIGWRFQARDRGGDVRMFEVRQVDGEWELLRVYE